MDEREQQAYIFGGILTLANRLQILGDKLDERMTLKQWLLIAVILKSGKPALTLSETAEQFGSSRQNVKKMALILQKRGLVALERNPKDARAFRLRLTPQCLTYFEGRSGKEEAFMASLFQGFSPSLTQPLYDGVVRMLSNVAEMEKEQQSGEEE